MSVSTRWPSMIVITFLVAGTIILSFKFFMATDSSGVGAVVEPSLTQLAQRGKGAFDANCATCHGPGGSGTDRGPPLIHDIYNPGHHGDAAFLIAAQRGVRQHHWQFGNMPPQPQVSQDDIRAIVRYIREVQLANGIRTKPHRM